MPKKEPTITITEEVEGSDTPIVHELTSEEWALVNAYFECGMNQTQGYLLVHPNSGYDSARTTASTLFAKPNIKAAVKKLLNDKAMSAEEALARISDIARGSHAPFIRFADDGFVYFDFSHPEAKNNLHLIKKIETKRERRIEGEGDEAEEWEGEWIKVELHDAYAANLTVLKYHGKLTEKVDLSNKDGSLKSVVNVYLPQNDHESKP